MEKIWLPLLACTVKTESEVSPKSKISIIFYNKRNEKFRLNFFLYKNKLTQKHKFKNVLLLYITLHCCIWFSVDGTVMWSSGGTLVNLSNIISKYFIHQKCFLKTSWECWIWILTNFFWLYILPYLLLKFCMEHLLNFPQKVS